MQDREGDITVERRERIAWIVFDRAEKANALTLEMQLAVRSWIHEAQLDPELDAVIVMGRGARAFSSGADMKQAPPSDPAVFRERRSEAMFGMLEAVLRAPVPVVAALNGPAAGSGALLALVADARIAVAGASLSLPEIRSGQPTFAGATIVADRLDRTLAGDLVQTARQMDMDEAQRLGLLQAVVEPEALEDAARQIAASLAEGGQAFRLHKEWLNRDLIRNLADAARQSAATRAAGADWARVGL